jgi:glycerol kinase
MSRYTLAIDQGTTSCRAIIFDEKFDIKAIAQQEFTQYFPQEGWVEHDATEIWTTQLNCCHQALSNGQLKAEEISCIGITNQRETIVAWDKSTGNPIYNAIVWQDRRTASACIEDEKNIGNDVADKTGLTIDAYFSAPKIRWILENAKEAKSLIATNNLCVGTIDTWLLWKLTAGKVFATDVSNASRTNIFNIQTLNWDTELLDYYQIPTSILPEVKDSIGLFGNTDSSIFGIEISISGIAGDQQASLFGHQCINPGMVKNTFGTGCFLLKNIGNQFVKANQGLLTTIAWSENKQITYAIEGAVFNAGTALKWLKDDLELIKSYDELDSLAMSIDSCEELVVVPAFTGLGAPHWDSFARGLMIGISRNTSKAHIVRATLESIAYQTKDIIDAMNIGNSPVQLLSVDGGVSSSAFLVQFLADILQVPIQRALTNECTALGAALMANKGIRKNLPILNENKNTIIYPKISIEERDLKYKKWQKAVERSKSWVEI